MRRLSLHQAVSSRSLGRRLLQRCDLLLSAPCEYLECSAKLFKLADLRIAPQLCRPPSYHSSRPHPPAYTHSRAKEAGHILSCSTERSRRSLPHCCLGHHRDQQRRPWRSLRVPACHSRSHHICPDVRTSHRRRHNVLCASGLWRREQCKEHLEISSYVRLCRPDACPRNCLCRYADILQQSIPQNSALGRHCLFGAGTTWPLAEDQEAEARIMKDVAKNRVEVNSGSLSESFNNARLEVPRLSSLFIASGIRLQRLSFTDGTIISRGVQTASLATELRFIYFSFLPRFNDNVKVCETMLACLYTHIRKTRAIARSRYRVGAHYRFRRRVGPRACTTETHHKFLHTSSTT